MKKVSFLLFLLLVITKIHAQHIHLYVQSMQGIIYESTFSSQWNGGSAGIAYSDSVSKKIALQGNLEFQISPWGNNVLLHAGMRYFTPISSKFLFSWHNSVQQGLALFTPSPLYVFGFTTMANIEYVTPKKNTIYLGTGLRYYNCPAYRDYAYVTSYLDFPIEIGYRIALNKKK